MIEVLGILLIGVLALGGLGFGVGLGFALFEQVYEHVSSWLERKP